MPLPMEYVIDGAPVSRQTKRRQRLSEWKQNARIAARQDWSVEPPFPGEVMVSITYYFADNAPDVDNVPKPIMDALKDLVSNPTLLGPLQTSEPFLHIKVAEAPSQEVAC